MAEAAKPSADAMNTSTEARVVLLIGVIDSPGLEVGRLGELRGDGDARPDGFTWRRNAPGFSQRMDLTMSPDGDAIVSRGEFSRDGATWEGDLELTYRRIQ